MPQRPIVAHLFSVRHADAGARRRGASVLAVTLLLLAFTLIIGVIGLVDPSWRESALAVGATLPVWVGAALLARTGRVTIAALLVIATTLAPLVAAPILAGRVAFTPFFFLIPVLLGMVMVPADTLWLVSALTLGALGLLAWLARDLPASSTAVAEISIISALFIAIISALGWVGLRAIERAFRAASEARHQAEASADALQQEKDRLAARVEERTADLAQALAAAQRLSADQGRLLAENAEQRAVIRAFSVPVLPLDLGMVAIPLVGALDQARLADLREQTLHAIKTFAARRVLLDITGVPLIDHEGVAALMGTLRAARLLGAELALVGVRPEVAQALVALGAPTGGLASFSTLQLALQHYRAA